MESETSIPAETNRQRVSSRQLVLGVLAGVPAISQPELVRRTGLSRATVAGVIADLDRDGRIRRVGRANGPRGRPPRLLSLHGAAGLVAGVDLGHTHATVAVATTEGTLLSESRIDFDVDTSGIQALVVAADGLAVEIAKHEDSAIKVVSLGVPGPLERSADGSVRSGGVMSGWSDLEPIHHFRERLERDVIVTVDNDAQLGAVGEHVGGAARGCATALYLKVGDGVGSGLIVDNLLYRGGHGLAGEIGHVRVVDHGVLCRCGGRGCLETVASMGFALSALQQVHGPDLDVEDIAALLAAHDASAWRLFEDIGETIGSALAGPVATFDPEIIVIGSALLHPAPLCDAAMRALVQRTQPFVSRRVRIVPGQLGTRASLMGTLARAARMTRVVEAGL